MPNELIPPGPPDPPMLDISAEASLEEMAKQINIGHNQYLYHANLAVQHAYSALEWAKYTGDWMNAVAASKEIKYGDLGAWFKKNVPDIAQSTRSEYSRIASNWDEKNLGECRSKTEAIELLDKKKPRGPGASVGNKMLETFEMVKGGLTTREVIDQSNCFAFKDKRVHTFNDEIYYSAPFDVNFTGAVEGKPFLEVLENMGDEIIKVDKSKSWDSNEVHGEIILKFRKKDKRVGLTVEKEFLLLIGDIEEPGEWHELPYFFEDALYFTLKTASHDEANFQATCIHFTPEWMESCDDQEATRYHIKMPIEKDILMRSSALKGLQGLQLTHMSLTKDWVHFKNGVGLLISCRKYEEEYPDLNEVLDVKGTPISLDNQAISDAAKKANIFSKEDIIDNRVAVTLMKDEIRLKGEGVTGWFEERYIKTDYTGNKRRFLIDPGQLIRLVRENAGWYTEDFKCIIGDKRLRMSCENIEYITAFGVDEEETKDEDTPETESGDDASDVDDSEIDDTTTDDENMEETEAR